MSLQINRQTDYQAMQQAINNTNTTELIDFIPEVLTIEHIYIDKVL
jgi:hypothetical protein